MENEITKAPYDWEAGNTNQGDEPQLPVEPINGGIRDERFEPTVFDEIVLKVEAAKAIAKATPQLVSLVYGYLTMNWKIIIGSLTSLIVAFLVSKWPALQSFAIGDWTLAQIVSYALVGLATLILPAPIAKWKKEHPNEDLGAK